MMLSLYKFSIDGNIKSTVDIFAYLGSLPNVYALKGVTRENASVANVSAISYHLQNFIMKFETN